MFLSIRAIQSFCSIEHRTMHLEITIEILTDLFLGNAREITQAKVLFTQIVHYLQLLSNTFTNRYKASE